MVFLLRVELPDVPGSLGLVASAIGHAGGDIEAIEIVEHREHSAVDDVLLQIPPGTMPDSIVSACTALEGVRVLWISRYAAGGNLFLDLEVVEAITAEPEQAHERLLELLPVAFRADWAARVRRPADPEGPAEVLGVTSAAPESLDWIELERPERLAASDENTELVGAPSGDDTLFLVGRRGGPDFLASELARLAHLVSLADSIQRTASAGG